MCNDTTQLLNGDGIDPGNDLREWHARAPIERLYVATQTIFDVGKTLFANDIGLGSDTRSGQRPRFPCTPIRLLLRLCGSHGEQSGPRSGHSRPHGPRLGPREDHTRSRQGPPRTTEECAEGLGSVSKVRMERCGLRFDVTGGDDSRGGREKIARSGKELRKTRRLRDTVVLHQDKQLSSIKLHAHDQQGRSYRLWWVRA